MKNNLKKFIAFVFIAVLLCLNIMPVMAEETTVDNSQEVVDGIVAFNLEKSKTTNINEWINSELVANPAGGGEWYVLALSQNGKYNFSSYESALKQYLKNNKVSSASSRLKFALTLSAIGSTDSYIYTVLNEAIGKQGIMSYVYGLHLINNGYTSQQITKAEIINKILSFQLDDGGFAIYGAYGDVDVTSMTVQAVAEYYKTNTNVKTAVDKAVEFLSKSQNDDGTFNSYGVKNPESGAQVLVALSSLNINPLTDDRFIKNNATILDGIKIFMLQNKSFSHTLGGEYSSNATTQVFYSLVALNRIKQNKSAFYILDNCNVKGLEIPTSSTVTSSSSSNNENIQVGIANNSVANENTLNSEKSTTTSSVVNSSAVNSENNETTSNNSINSQLNSNEIKSDDKNTEPKISYKIIITIVILVLAAITCVLMFVFKRKEPKHYLLVVVIAALLIALTFILNIQSVDEFQNSAKINKPNAIGSVTITVNCNTLKNELDNTEILPQTKWPIEKGDTAYDVLFEALTTNKIHFETSGLSDNIYVEGINNIYEFSYGELSGWLYFVNGETPPMSISKYELAPNDKIEVLYTTSMGEDLK